MNKLADLPNTEGFRFYGVCHDGTRAQCVIVKDEKTGLHRVGGELIIEDLQGWEPAPYMPETGLYISRGLSREIGRICDRNRSFCDRTERREQARMR